MHATRERIQIVIDNRSFSVVSLVGREQLCAEYHFSMWLECDDTLATESLPGRRATVYFQSIDSYTREVTGIITEFNDLGKFQYKRRYKIILCPRLKLLSGISDSRVLVDVDIQSLLEILAQDAGYHKSQIKWYLNSPLPRLSHFVQAQESHATLLQRVIRQFGLIYWFESENAVEHLVFSDSSSQCPFLERGQTSLLAEDGLSHTTRSGKQFVGFTTGNLKHRMMPRTASATHQEQHIQGGGRADLNYFEPVANTRLEAENFATYQSQASLCQSKVLNLKGNIPDVFAGSRISINDSRGINVSGDWLCFEVVHKSTQINDQSHDGRLSSYSCEVKCVPKTTPYKLPYLLQQTRPMVFTAKVEALDTLPMLDTDARYRGRYHFDDIARPLGQSSPALSFLSRYACTQQPQATGWHFPLLNGTEIVIGCFNNDPNHSFLLGAIASDEQPSMVTGSNPWQNRMVSSSGSELCFEDKENRDRIILQTLDSTNSFILDGKQNNHLIRWLSLNGQVEFIAAKNLLLTSNEGSINTKSERTLQQFAAQNLQITSLDCDIRHESANTLSVAGETINLSSNNKISIKSNSYLILKSIASTTLKTDKGKLFINAPRGTSLIQSKNGITLNGKKGAITLLNGGGQIRITSSGNVELFGTDVLSINGNNISLEGSVDYQISDPIQAPKQKKTPQPPIAEIPKVNLNQEIESKQRCSKVILDYHYQDGEPVQNAPYHIQFSDGTELSGSLDKNGKTQIDDAPVGQYKVTIGEDSRDYEFNRNSDKVNQLFGKISASQAIAMVDRDNTELLDEAKELALQAGDWIWGTLQGDFNENPTISQIVIGTIVSTVPVVDQLMDCRDVCANIMVLTDDDQANDTGGWIALAITGIGFIPVIGSALKGVSKVIIKNPEQLLSPALAILRRTGKGDPIEFLKTLDWDKISKQANDLVKKKAIAIQDALNKIIDSFILRKYMNQKAFDSLNSNANKITEILPKLDAGIRQAIEDIRIKLSKALDSYQGEPPIIGKTDTPTIIKTRELEEPQGNDFPLGRVRGPRMQRHTPPCFTPGKNLIDSFKGNRKKLEKEFYTQLKAQEAGLNKMTVGEYLNNRNVLQSLTKEHGHEKARSILTLGGKNQKLARQQFETNIRKSIIKSLRKKGVGIHEARRIASEQVQERLQKLAAIHDPDIIAGGKDKIAGLGNTNINSSIGSQWSSGDRIKGMDKAARQALESFGPDARMHINLDRCD